MTARKWKLWKNSIFLEIMVHINRSTLMVSEILNKQNNIWTKITFAFVVLRLDREVSQFNNNLLQDILHSFWVTKVQESFQFIDNYATFLFISPNIRTRQQVWMFLLQQESFSIILLCGQVMNNQKFMDKSSNFNRINPKDKSHKRIRNKKNKKK